MNGLEGQTKAASRKESGPLRHILAAVPDRSNAKQHTYVDSLPRRSRVPHDGVMSILGSVIL
jgi:hypothetical protein